MNIRRKAFKTAVEKYLGSQFVQPLAAQIGDNVSESSYKIMKPTMDKQIVQMPSGQFPNILFLTTLSNHYTYCADVKVLRNVSFIYFMHTKKD